jgi:hypothetical protein
MAIRSPLPLSVGDERLGQAYRLPQCFNTLNNRCLATAVLVCEGGENMTLSRKMIWIGGGLVALAVLIVVLVLVYSGGGSGGGY